MVGDEHRHAELCAAVVEALGGAASAELPHLPEVPEHADADPLEAALRNVISISCLSETVAVALIDAERRTAGPPALADLLSHIVADEVQHARSGWRLLEDCARRLGPVLRERLHVLSRIVWHYDSSGVQARRRFGSLYEPILHCVKDPARYTFNADEIRVEAPTGARRRLIDHRKPVPALYSSDKVPGNVWYFPRVRYRMPEYEQHPTQKPEALLARIIAASSRPGELVLDLFAGSFTASAVAQRLGRRSLAVEQEPEFIAIGLRRLGLAERFRGRRLRPSPKRPRSVASRRLASPR